MPCAECDWDGDPRQRHSRGGGRQAELDVRGTDGDAVTKRGKQKSNSVQKTEAERPVKGGEVVPTDNDECHNSGRGKGNEEERTQQGHLEERIHS